MQRTVKIGKHYCIDEKEVVHLSALQKNYSKAETKFYQDALKAGWEVFQAGWPDYLIYSQVGGIR